MCYVLIAADWGMLHAKGASWLLGGWKQGHCLLRARLKSNVCCHASRQQDWELHSRGPHGNMSVVTEMIASDSVPDSDETATLAHALRGR